MATLQEIFQTLFQNFNSYALLIGAVQAFLVYLLWSAHKVGDVSWTDMITSKASNRISLTKFLQLVGGLTGTWIMIYMTLHDRLTYDIFVIYLTYVGACEGFSKYISAKYNPIQQSSVTTTSSDQNVGAPPFQQTPPTS